MKYRSSKETEKKIINLLLDKKEYAQYEMPEAIGKDYHTIFRRLHDLKKAGMVFLVREEGAKNRKIFALTFKGLINSLLLPENRKKLPEIIAKYPYWLLTFKKWNLFKQAGLEKLMLSYVELGVLNIFKMLVYSQKFFNKKYLITKETLKLFDSQFLFVPVLFSENKKLAEVLKSDPDLRAFIEEEFEHQLKDFETLQDGKSWWDRIGGE